MSDSAYASVELNSFKGPPGNFEKEDDTQPLYTAEKRSSSTSYESGLKGFSISSLRGRITRWLNKKSNYTLVLCLMTTLFLFADQNLMAPNLSAIADEFNIADDERDARLGGDVAVAFFIVGGPFGIIAGWYTDRLPRNKMYGSITCVGATGSFLTSLVTSHFQLLMARALTGIAIGGAAPILFSLLSDLYSVEQRNLVVATVGFFMSFGSMAGQALSGVITSSMGPSHWKLPFLFISIPCFVCGLLVFFTTTDPPRAAQEATVKRRLSITDVQIDEETGSHIARGAHPDFGASDGNGSGKKGQAYKGKASCKKVVELFKIKSNVLLFLQGIPGCVPWGILGSFMNDYLSSDRGATVMEATAVIVMFSVGDFLGKIIGGTLGQYMYNRSKKSVCLLMGGTTMLGTIPFVYLLNAPFDLTSFCFISLLGGCTAAITGGNIKAIVLNVNIPEMRGVANGLFGLTDDLGRGFGPALIAFLEMAVGGRRAAFTIGAFFWVICGALILAIYFTCEEDEAAVQRHVRTSSGESLLVESNDEESIIDNYEKNN